MGNELKGRPEHSAEHFGDTRDHWWNADFLRLLAARWRLHEARDVLDVGCGVGHWGALLAGLLPRDARLTGLDREAGWIAEARARAPSRGLEGRATYVEGDLRQLPFPDDTFDLTTCQTVLIHMQDPAAALAEMARVTRPGGLVLAAEPNNLTESLLLDAVTSEASTDDLVDLVRLQLTCERGKVALGEGDNSLGDRVPGLFAAQGLADVAVYVNDKATAVFPPYASAGQRAVVDEAKDRAARRLWNWTEDDARRLFLAGGGHPPSFSGLFARALALRERSARAMDAGTYHGVSGGLFYVVSGRKV